MEVKRFPSTSQIISIDWSERDRTVKVMKRYVGTVFFISILYWLWALYNIVSYVYKGGTLSIGKFDYGIVTFFLVVVSCAVFLNSCIPHFEDGGRIPNHARVWFPWPQVFVSANYLLWLIIKSHIVPWNKVLYYSTFGLGWLLLSVVSCNLVIRWSNIVPAGNTLLSAEERYVSVEE